MNVELVTAIGYLIAEGLSTGLTIKAMVEAAEGTGKLSEEQKDMLRRELDEAKAGWLAAPGPKQET